MNNKQTKDFINEFNFERPNWSVVPSGFSNVNKQGLTKEEGHLLEAIEMAWRVSQPNSFYIKKMFNTGFGVASIMAVFMVIIMFSYYVNIEYNLGFTFLTEMFA